MTSTIRNRALGALAALAALTFAACAWTSPALADEGAAASFSDVPEGAWYVESGALDFVVSKGVMVGLGDGSFAPQAQLTRAQAVTILYNLAGNPEAGSAVGAFADIEADAWYSDAVTWACSTKPRIVSGYDDGTFRPNDPVTREQLARMLSLYAMKEGWLALSEHHWLNGFQDAHKVSSWALSSVAWCARIGIINGKLSDGNSYLAPTDAATRAETAQMVQTLHKDVLSGYRIE